MCMQCMSPCVYREKDTIEFNLNVTEIEIFIINLVICLDVTACHLPTKFVKIEKELLAYSLLAYFLPQFLALKQ